MKPALLIIDLQKAWYFGEMKTSMDKACHTINAIIPTFRKKQLPLIWIQHIDKNDGVEPGHEGFEFIPALKPEATDYRVSKRYLNGFNKTDLPDIIRQEKVDTVIITGFCAEYCVLTTYRGALDHDLVPILLKDSLASGNREHIRFVENISDLITVNAFNALVDYQP